MTHTAALAPGRRTRRNSANPRAGSGKNCKPSWQTKASKLSSLNGNAWPSAATGWKCGLFSRSRAHSSIAGAMSAPTRSSCGPNNRESSERGLTSSSGNIENPLLRRDSRRAYDHGNKKARPPPNPTVIGRIIDNPTRWGMKSWPKACGHTIHQSGRPKSERKLHRTGIASLAPRNLPLSYRWAAEPQGHRWRTCHG